MVLAGYGCISCIIDDLVGALLPLVEDERLRQKVIRRSLYYLADNFSLNEVPSTYITGVHRILKEETKIAIPYEKLRQRCNEIGKEISSMVWHEVQALDAEERFRLLTRWAIAGNELDFRTVGTGYTITVQEIRQMLEQCVAKPLAIDHISQIYQLLTTPGKVLYIPDNVGELAFDLLLIKEIQSYGNTVMLPLRGGPITSDATMQDGEFFNVNQIVDEVFQAGPDTLGILLHEASSRLLRAIDEADVVITKGQANFYTFSEQKKKMNNTLICLLRTKCDWVTNTFGLSGKINVAAMLRP